MAQVANIPKPLADALFALERRIPGASTDVEAIEGLESACYYRVAVLSEHFRGMDYDDRHDLVWQVVRDVVSDRSQHRIISILSLTPEELNGE